MFAVIRNSKIKDTFTKRADAEKLAGEQAARHGTDNVRLWEYTEFELKLGGFTPAQQKAKKEQHNGE